MKNNSNIIDVFYNICYLNYINRNLLDKTEPIPKCIINSDQLYKYAYSEYLEVILGSNKLQYKDMSFMNKETHNYFKINTINIVTDSLLKIPKIGFILCEVDEDLVGKLLDAYIYRKNDKYYISFIIDDHIDLQRKEIFYNSRKLF